MSTIKLLGVVSAVAVMISGFSVLNCNRPDVSGAPASEIEIRSAQPGQPIAFTAAYQETVDPLLLQALAELDVSSEAFFTLLDTQDITQFVRGVKHAARGRILLEQYLGEDIGDVSWEATRENQDVVQLRLIAKRAEDLSAWAAEDLWRMDYDTKNAALLRLSEMDQMVKSAKQSRGWK